MSLHPVFSGPNLAAVRELYDVYRRDPAAVDVETRTFFAAHAGEAWLEGDAEPTATAAGADLRAVVGAARLARNIREYGHLSADVNPLAPPAPARTLEPETHGVSERELALLPGTIVWPDDPRGAQSAAAAIGALRQLYSGPIGFDFAHVDALEERQWLRQAAEDHSCAVTLSADEARALLSRLTWVEGLERFLHQTFLGQKRFSIEGTDMLVPMLDLLIADAVAAGVRAVFIGMAHRGRLNVLAHVLGKPYAAIFSEFHGDGARPSHEIDMGQGWSGDVKYHLGRRRTIQGQGAVEVRVVLANNPSHLEFVNPVVAGLTRAAQETRDQPGAPEQDPGRALAVTIHGDAAFPGEGVVAETLNLSRLGGYGTGGTVHIVLNNQVGFTTEPEDGRSTRYAADLSKGFEIPILHVNADRPLACLEAIRIAHRYRTAFAKDVLVDLIGYRRWGHNEGDDPAYTQPVATRQIVSHPTVRAIWAAELAKEGVLTAEEAQALEAEVAAQLKAAQGEAAPPPAEPASPALPDPVTAVPASRLRRLQNSLLEVPAGFHVNPKLSRLVLERRREALDKPGGIDWAQAEALAFASLLADGVPVRLSGQDSLRGTFSQRHLALFDAEDGHPFVALSAIPEARAAFAAYNSPLSEAAVLGFEYGYSLEAAETLVLWEAQFGDFANAGQVIIDQFISAARAKWREVSGLVLLLPHGYEGQGPEHSSARLERYLQLAAEDNLGVANLTSAAQYFHLLRRQAGRLTGQSRPIALMAPKSLLRNPLAASSLDELAHGSFCPVLAQAGDPAAVRRVVIGSGKVMIDLAAAMADAGTGGEIATIRLEEIAPFPRAALARELAALPHLESAIWLQEEPRNMGAYAFVRPELSALLPAGVTLSYAGRPPRAATAEGDPDVHQEEQNRIIAEALGHSPLLAGSKGGSRRGS